MPELPDVESFKRYFKKTSLNQKIVGVEGGGKDFKRKLIGKSFKDAWRRGKFLIIEFKEIPEKVVMHFGMTGDLHYVKQGAEKTGEDRFTRFTFKFANGYELRWLNMRKFGKVYLVRNPKEVKLIREMGPEPLELSKKEFFKLLKEQRDKNIKAFLLDQRDIAGIGNVYSDEMLFRAKIDPHRDIETFTNSEKEKLYQSMIEVLKEAIQVRPPRGMLFGAFWLLPHRRGDMKCPRNKNHQLKRETIAGRAAIYCPICQK